MIIAMAMEAATKYLSMMEYVDIKNELKNAVKILRLLSCFEGEFVRSDIFLIELQCRLNLLRR